MIENLRNISGVSLIFSITQKLYWDVSTKVLIQLSKIRVLCNLMELTNKSEK